MLCSAPSYSLFPLENDTIKHRVFVTANTADIEEDSIIYTELKNLFSAHREPFTFIINGDLISEDITRENASFQMAKIRKLLETSSGSENGRVVVIPGERDWADSGEEGWRSVKELEKLVKDLGYSHVTWANKKGCPGPRVIKLNPNLLLVTINTQWWNHPYDKPKPVDAKCDVITDIDFQEALEDVLDENKDKNILIAGHYPIISLGEYGGYMPVTRYIFPLPVVGGFIAAYHRNVGSSDDIVNENFNDIRRMLGQTIAYRKTLIYLSGHELNLQILNRGENYAINSGSIGMARHAGRNRSALISEKMRGVTEIVYYESGRIDSIVHEFTEADGFTLHSRFNLYQEACGKVEGAAPVNTAIVPCEEKPVVTEKMAGTYDAPVIVAAGPEYAAGRFKRFWFGDHYRDTWTQEVEVPYLDLDNTFGGLTPYRRGGGRQTKSLRLKAPDGRRYVFRSVNKDASVRLPYDLRNTVAGDVMRDQSTIAPPYGALAADVIQTELGFLHPHPQLYVMPDDEKLGPFREEFGNMLGMLEEFPRDPDKGEAAYADADQVLKSYKLFSKLYTDHDNRINSQSFARVRMFDILIGAWDRHEDNWKWAGYDQTKGKEYEPIPRDRDNIFTLFDGFLPFMIDREWALPMFEEFDYEIKGLRSLTWQARHLDRFLASELSRDDWVEAAKFVQERVTDEVIETAVRNMPPETYEISGKEIEAKLKERIKDLATYAEEYYELLAREVDVVGSNDDEYFEVLRNEDGSVAVVVYNIADKGSKERGNKLLYRRTFYPKETKEVRLFGLGGEDVFFVEGESKKSIKVRIVGGRGDDTYEDTSRVRASAKKTRIYEKDVNENIDVGKEAKLVSSVNESAYDYDRTAFKYNTYLPLLWVLYNSSNKLVFAGALQFTTQRYGKEDYSTKHFIGAGLATGGSKVVGYDGNFHHVLGKWDVTLRGGVAYPAYVVEFYGLGNDTVKEDDLLDDDYYRFNFNSFQVSTGLVREFWKVSSFGVELNYEYNSETEPVNTGSNILETDDFIGEEQTSFADAKVTLDLDLRDSERLPERGWRLFLSHDNGVITNKDYSNFGKTLGYISWFSTARIVTPTTLGLRVGGGHSYGDIPFYRQFSLGGDTYLRGFRKNRFTGDDMLFLNSDLRFKILGPPYKRWPIDLGLKAFFDSGKIIEDEFNFNDLHYGYGFGFYLFTYDERTTINFTFGFSDEESWQLQFALGAVF